MFKLDLEKVEQPENKLLCWIIGKAREFQKNIYFFFIDSAKAVDCVNHNELANSLRDGNTGGGCCVRNNVDQDLYGGNSLRLTGWPPHVWTFLKVKERFPRVSILNV